MKRLSLTISFLFFYLLSFAQLDGKMRPGDRLDYNPGPQPGWEPILIAMAAGIGCLLIAGIGFWISWKEDCSKFRKIVGTILMFAGFGGFAFFILPCLMTWRFWVLLVAIEGPILTIACLIHKKREENEYLKQKEEESAKQKEEEPIKQDISSYTYLGEVLVYTTRFELPNDSEYKSSFDSLNLLYPVYSKDGHYFLKSPYDESYIELEPNPYFEDLNYLKYESALYLYRCTVRDSFGIPTYFYLNLPNHI